MNINFKLPIKIGSTGFFSMNNTTKEAVKENIRLTILTNKNERIVTGIGSSFSFSSFDKTTDEIDSIIKQQIEELFNQYFNYIKVDKVIITHPETGNSLQENQVMFSIKYSYKGIDNFSDEVSGVLN